MNARADKVDKSHSARLEQFTSELRDHIDDEAMLREIHAAIKSLLGGNGASEREIRRLLQSQHDHGDLREESFELVQKLIDRIVLESTPADTADPDASSDPFGATTVIPVISLNEDLADQQLQVGSVLRDRFMLQEEISGGSMGTVYKALDRRLAEADSGDHWVAIKVLSPALSRDGNALRALQQEAAKTRCLAHPNIVRFIDLDRDDELYYLVMEWLDGRTLASVLDDSENKRLDLHKALDIVRQVGMALEYAHQRGVIHADVKPGNIMVTASGEVKLFDFGIARIRQKQNEISEQFDPGVLKAASPAYSSMQVLTGEDPVPADDVFSLACLAYRLIAGYRVFGPRNAAEAAEAGMEPQPLENLSKEQWKALKKALSFSRVTRFSSPAEFVDALIGSNKASNVSDDTAEVEALEIRRSPWRIVAILLIFVAAAAAIMQGQLMEWLDLAGDTPTVARDADPPAPDEGLALPEDTRQANQAAPDSAPTTTPGSDATETVIAEPAEQPVPEIFPVADADFRATSALPPAAESPPATEPQSASELLPASAIIPLAGPGDSPEVTRLAISEDGEPLILDFVRESHLEEVISLQLVEGSHSGNRSPLESGQYLISNDGLLEFQAGQHRVRLEISMASDPAREADQDVTLEVRDTEYGDVEFATINLRLLDDDQRTFEDSLAANTVAFAVSQVSVREGDSAVQIDVIRYRADQTPLDVPYVIRDVTATEGDDYVDPGESVVQFAPGQRTARILIPLVQDVARESDEAFMLELSGDAETEANIYRRIAVMIRDDDT